MTQRGASPFSTGKGIDSLKIGYIQATNEMDVHSFPLTGVRIFDVVPEDASRRLGFDGACLFAGRNPHL